MRLTSEEISRLIPAGLLGTQWQAIKDFARAVEAATAERCAKLCAEYGDAEWAKFKNGITAHRGNPYIEGLSDGAHEVADAIRAAYKEPTNE